jgi:hypothetical protein
MRLKKIWLLAAAVLCAVNTNFAQSKATNTPDKPKLIIGIVTDQMRWDYLYRYAGKYTQGGFKRLLSEGYSCENTHINYLPSYTGPGHSCVYTGSVPAIHGIAGNEWYDRNRHGILNCVEDDSVKLVGNGALQGNVSPRNLLSTTITDELLLATNYQSKVVSLALKDRSAVIPGGHKPTGAYFVDGSTGNFITTTYYSNQLPAWVTKFNDKKLAEKYLAQNWNTLRQLAEYTESTGDDEFFERKFKGEKAPVFPHSVAELSKGNLDIIAATPYGNSLTLNFAEAAIEGEKLGSGKFTDFLAISLSSTDLIGHQFGPNSVEVEDCYLRLDSDLAKFFTYLDKNVGKGNYLVFITADHGAGHAVDFLKEKNISAGSFPVDSVTEQVKAVVKNKLGEGDWILKQKNMQFYLNLPLLEQHNVTRDSILRIIKTYMLNYAAVANVIDLQDLDNSTLPAAQKNMMANGYNLKRSGDLQILYTPGWFEDYSKGATHGSLYAYDTHIPLVWMGWKIKHAEDHTDVHMTDIAPTLAAMLHIQEPSGCIGKVIQGIFK